MKPLVSYATREQLNDGCQVFLKFLPFREMSIMCADAYIHV